MKRFVFIALTVLFSLSITGCAKKAVFTYSPEEATGFALSSKPLPLTVAVMPFEDARGKNNVNNQFVCVIPLMLYCSLSYDRPDTENRFLFVSAYTFHPAEDFASAVADELQQHRFFENVVFDRQGQQGQGTDLVVTGKIIETRYYGENASYGLSLWAPFLWYIGLPAGKVNNSISLAIEMRRASDGVVVWSHEVRGTRSEIVGAYYNWAADFEGFPLILREGLHQGMEKLAAAIKIKEPNYWSEKVVSK
jgi:hypothetical protein